MSKKQQNLLIIGLVGSGKSTMVNAIANFFEKKSYYDQHSTLVPNVQYLSKYDKYCIFECTYPKYKNLKVENKSFEISSQTQQVTIYELENSTTILRLIDTPGITLDYDFFHLNQIIEELGKLNGIIYVQKTFETKNLSIVTTFVEKLQNLFTIEIKKNFFAALTFYNQDDYQKAKESLKDLNMQFVDYLFFDNYLIPHTSLVELGSDLDQFKYLLECKWGNGLRQFEKIMKKLVELPEIYSPQQIRKMTIEKEKDNLYKQILEKQNKINEIEAKLNILTEQIELMNFHLDDLDELQNLREGPMEYEFSVLGFKVTKRLKPNPPNEEQVQKIESRKNQIDRITQLNIRKIQNLEMKLNGILQQKEKLAEQLKNK